MDKQRPTILARKGPVTLTDTHNLKLDFDRIEYLINPAELSDTLVTVVGLGSGGAPACDHLTMNGVRQWHLYDPDTLDEVNLVKHPRCRTDGGMRKVDAQKNWIIDRNPTANVSVFPEDILASKTFESSVGASSLVLACPDRLAVREYIGDKCVAHKTPFVVAAVFRTGIGGEVYSFVPGETGCYRCLQRFAADNDMDLTDDALGLTEDEEYRIYGLGEKDFKASGLSIDIQMIALLQSRMALSIITRHMNTQLPP